MKTTRIITLNSATRIITWLMIVLVASTGPLQIARADVPNQHSIHQPGAAASRRNSPPLKRPSLSDLTKPVKRTLTFSANPSDLEISDSRVFFGPLEAMDDKVIPSENQALAKALLAFKNKNNPEDISEIVRFLNAYPKSRWGAALEADIAQNRFETGYLTGALKYWTSAWQHSKAETKPQRKAVADQAISNLVFMQSALGLKSDLERNLSDIAKRSLTGSVEQRVSVARKGLWSMKHHPETSFKCGPFAVNILAKLHSPSTSIACSNTIKKAASTSRGTNLAQTEDWAQQVGLNLQMAKRSTGSSIIHPSLMHWKVGHFAAIIAEDKGRYRIQDPTFGDQGTMWVSKQALESQTDGYFLVPNGTLPAGWQTINRQEAANVWGKGVSTQCDPGLTSTFPKQSPGPPCATCCGGMAQASVFAMNATLNIKDTPLGYKPPVGPNMDISVNYNFGEGMQPSPFTFPNLGYDWSLNWVSYLTVSGSTLTVRVRGGGYEVYAYNSNISGYTQNLTSQALMVDLGGGSYQRRLPDGSVENFTLSDGTNIYMTSVVDPQGNAATITYDTMNHYRITQIQDAAGNSPITFTYVSNTYGGPDFYNIAKIEDGFGTPGRSATFAYNYVSGVAYLTSITDAAGNVSQFAYDTSSSFINMMTTPYGSTNFYQYTPAGSAPYPPTGLRFAFPDGSTSVIENWLYEDKRTYFWDREAASLYPNDPANLNYTHCKITKWLWESSNNNEAPVASWIKPALEAPVIYSYPNEGNEDICGTSNRPIQIARQVSGFQNTATVTGTNPAGTVFSIYIVDPYVDFGGGPNISYTSPTAEPNSIVAAALAAEINARADLTTFGITATSVSDVVIITSHSVYPTAIGTLTPTVIKLKLGPNPVETGTLSGTVTAGDVLTAEVMDPGLSGGHEFVNYTVQANDTLSTIAQNLAIATNSNTNLQAIGVSAVWTVPSRAAPVVSFNSTSSNLTTYSLSASGGATETITAGSSTNGIVQAWNYRYQEYSGDMFGDVWSWGNVSQMIDPIGRQFNFCYNTSCNDTTPTASIDLLKVTETQGGDTFVLGQWQYPTPTQHRPTVYIDGSGNATNYAYNTFGELTTVTDALTNVTTLTYDGNGYLTQLQGPLSGSDDVTDFTFYGYGPLESVTDSEGYTLNYSYDKLNRLTSVAYPDGTSEQTIYSRLDAVQHCDRLGRWTQRAYNSVDQLAFETDPLGRQTSYCWCTCGSLATLTDPAGHTTTWQHDLEGRVTEKIYADSSTMNYVYEPNTSRLQSKTDALSQTTSFAYNLDNTLQEKTYSNVVNTTSPVTTAYDTVFPRTASVTNGWGQVVYNYNPYIASVSHNAYIWIGGYPETPSASDTINITFANSALSGGTYTMPTYTVPSGDAGNPAQVATDLAAAITSNSTLSAAGISAADSGTMITISAGSTVTVTSAGTGSTTATIGGGGRLAQVTNNVISTSPATYSYDSLGRTVNRMIDGGNNLTNWSYDAMSRITAEANPLGTFSYDYVDNTSGSSKGTLRLSSIGYPNSQTTNFGWLPNIGDQRLEQIQNLNPSSASLSQFNNAYNSAGEITQWQQQQNSTNVHQTIGYDLASQLTSSPNDSGSSFNAYVSGTPHTGDVVSVTAYDASLTGSAGQETASYTVGSGDSSSHIATQLASAMNTAMSNISVTASATGAAIAISTSPSYCTQFTCAVAGSGATDTIALSGSSPIQNLHKQLYYSYDCAANRTGVQGDSSGSFPTGLTTTATQATYNNVNELTATSAGGPITFQGTTVNPIIAASVNVTQAAVIGGTITPGDTLWVTVHDKKLSHAENIKYVVQGGDSTTSIATSFKNAINADSTLSSLGVTATSSTSTVTITSSSADATTYTESVSSGATESITIGGSVGAAASISPSTGFVGKPILASGANTASVTAVSGGGTPTTNTYPVTISSAAGTTLTYDADGNLTNDGTNSYSWDAENRLVKITYTYTGSGNNSAFTFDGLGRCAKIVETTSSSVTSTKQFIWCGNQRCEVRDASSSLTNQYFSMGQVNVSGGSTNYFYTKDHLGSIREMGHGSGGSYVLDSQFSYDPWGIPTQIAGSGAVPDFGYAQYYVHQRSGLNLTKYRAYNPTLGRWLSRDPIGEFGRSGVNLYDYVNNDPVLYKDPSGRNFEAVIPLAEFGGEFGGPWGAVAGGVLGLGLGVYGAWTAGQAAGNLMNQANSGSNSGSGAGSNAGSGSGSFCPRPSNNNNNDDDDKEDALDDAIDNLENKLGRDLTPSEISNLRGIVYGPGGTNALNQYVNSFYHSLEE